jgi:hypothetical protein
LTDGLEIRPTSEGHFLGTFVPRNTPRRRKSLIFNIANPLARESNRRKSLFFVGEGTANVPRCPKWDIESTRRRLGFAFHYAATFDESLVKVFAGHTSVPRRKSPRQPFATALAHGLADPFHQTPTKPGEAVKLPRLSAAGSRNAEFHHLSSA